MDQQFLRKSKEAQTDFAARRDDETGRFNVIKRDRPSGRQRIVAENLLDEDDARAVRNALIRASED
jgi:hypothetical protein